MKSMREADYPLFTGTRDTGLSVLSTTRPTLRKPSNMLTTILDV